MSALAAVPMTENNQGLQRTAFPARCTSKSAVEPRRYLLNGISTMQSLRTFSFLLTLLPLIGACSSTEMVESGAYSDQMSLKGETPESQIIKEGWLEVEVGQLADASEALRKIVSEEAGDIDSTRSQNDRQLSFSLRVPSDRFEAIIGRVSELGNVTSKSLNSRDVSEELVDLDARLKNLIALRDRLRELLTKATKVEEVINVERELTRVQTDIDRFEARNRLLRSRVAKSSLEVTLQQERLYGPLGYAAKGIWWVIEKLFVIR